MFKGKDQTYARDYNMKAIYELLSKEEMSCSELADRSGLSKPAMTKITSEMYRLNLIAQGDKTEGVSQSLGRKRVYLSVNPSFGIVAAIDFSTVAVKIWVCDMRGKVILKRSIPDSEYLTPEILENVCLQLKDMLESENVKDKELLSLCLAASGMVDKNSNDVVVSPKFKDCAHINLHQYFSDFFKCKVEIKNDVNLALIGEQKTVQTGYLTNAIMLYIDSGIGGALLIENKIREGNNGFAGEFGLIEVKTDNGYRPLDSLCSINAMKAAVRKRGRPASMPERFRFSDFVKAYYQNEAVVVDVVDDSIEILACVIRNLAVSLDIDTIIISGRVHMLGKVFLDKLRAATPKCKISYISTQDDSIVLGAVQHALKLAIDIVIDRRANSLKL